MAFLVASRPMRSVVALLIGLGLWPLGALGDPVASIRIRVLNGNNGNPMSGVGLLIDGTCAGPCLFLLHHVAWTTDDAGAIGLPNSDELRMLRLSANTRVKFCQPTRDADPHLRLGGHAEFAVDEILRRGVVAPNECNPRLTFAAHPGELIFFLRPLTWLEELQKPVQM